MNFLKNFGGSNMANMSMNKPTIGSKNNYFSSIQLESTDTASTSKKTNDSKAVPKKRGPPKEFIPNKYALNFNPPTIKIVLEYMNPQTKKLYHHKMKLKKLMKNTETEVALQFLKKSHRHYFGSGVIDEGQISKLIDKLKMGLDDTEDAGDVEDIDEDFEFDYEDDFDV